MLDGIEENKYRRVRLLGKGGMGAVYEAVHTLTGRRVALKIITGDLSMHSLESLKRFHREARAAGTLDSQHIVQVLDAGTEVGTGTPYLAMEYLHGQDLQQVLDRVGVLPPLTALRIVAQACVGLQKAHAARIVHRDIKPANLFLARGEEGGITVKILDFGLAKIKPEPQRHGDTTGLTSAGRMLGTPLYMSPEQVRNTKTVDHRTDLWSLGIALYRALSGRTPRDHINGFANLITALCSEPPEPIQSIAPWVRPDIAVVVHRALEFQPAHRFQSAEAMLEAIKLILPHGWALRDDQLVALETSERAVVAPKLPPTRVDPGARHVVRVKKGTPLAAGFDKTVPAAASPSRSWRNAAKRGAVLGVVGGALMLGLGAVALSMIHGTIAADEAASAVATASAVVTASPAATGSVALTASEERPLVEMRQQRVKIVVRPPTASVEIDGVLTQSKRGLVEITGQIGSIHRVRLFMGQQEIALDVAITQDGAFPPVVELSAPHQ